METHQPKFDSRELVLRKDGFTVAIGIAPAERVVGGRRLPPIQHFFPIGMVAALGGFDAETRIAPLAARAGGDRSALVLERKSEEGAELFVAGIEFVSRQIVGEIDEAGCETRHHAIDDGASSIHVTIFEAQQIDV